MVCLLFAPHSVSVWSKHEVNNNNTYENQENKVRLQIQKDLPMSWGG
jgi:hypothetical protein